MTLLLYLYHCFLDLGISVSFVERIELLAFWFCFSEELDFNASWALSFSDVTFPTMNCKTGVRGILLQKLCVRWYLGLSCWWSWSTVGASATVGVSTCSCSADDMGCLCRSVSVFVNNSFLAGLVTTQTFIEEYQMHRCEIPKLCKQLYPFMCLGKLLGLQVTSPQIGDLVSRTFRYILMQSLLAVFGIPVFLDVKEARWHSFGGD